MKIGEFLVSYGHLAVVNAVIALSGLIVASLYGLKLRRTVRAESRTLIHGILIIASGYFLYHAYWAVLFFSRYVVRVDWVEQTMRLEPLVVFVGGAFIALGYALHTRLFLKPLIPSVSLLRIALVLLLFAGAVYAALTSLYLADFATSYLASHADRLAIAGHAALGLIALIVTAVYVMASIRTREAEVRVLTRGIALVSASCVLYRIHWGVQSFVLGAWHPDVYAVLFNIPLYLGLVFAMVVTGYSIHIAYYFAPYGRGFPLWLVLFDFGLVFGFFLLSLGPLAHQVIALRYP